MPAGDPMWECPYCKKVYHGTYVRSCNCQKPTVDDKYKLPPHEPLNDDVKGLLEEIQAWMLDNDYECGEVGSDLYDRINKMLKKYE
jgi:hypothetical protein